MTSSPRYFLRVTQPKQTLLIELSPPFKAELGFIEHPAELTLLVQSTSSSGIPRTRRAKHLKLAASEDGKDLLVTLEGGIALELSYFFYTPELTLQLADDSTLLSAQTGMSAGGEVDTHQEGGWLWYAGGGAISVGAGYGGLSLSSSSGSSNSPSPTGTSAEPSPALQEHVLLWDSLYPFDFLDPELVALLPTSNAPIELTSYITSSHEINLDEADLPSTQISGLTLVLNNKLPDQTYELLGDPYYLDHLSIAFQDFERDDPFHIDFTWGEDVIPDFAYPALPDDGIHQLLLATENQTDTLRIGGTYLADWFASLGKLATPDQHEVVHQAIISQIESLSGQSFDSLQEVEAFLIAQDWLPGGEPETSLSEADIRWTEIIGEEEDTLVFEFPFLNLEAEHDNLSLYIGYGLGNGLSVLAVDPRLTVENAIQVVGLGDVEGFGY